MRPIAFRCLVIASLLLAGASLGVDEVWPELLPVAVGQAMGASQDPSMLAAPWFAVLLAAWAVASLVSTVGLMLFWGWARSLALWTTVAGVALYPLLGATAMSGWAAALAIAYVEPIGERFDGRAAPRPLENTT